MTTFRPRNTLEQLVTTQQCKRLVAEIVEGKRLDRPDIFAEYGFLGLPLRAATVLALLGLPQEMRADALAFVADKCGRESDEYDFLSGEFGQAEPPDEADGEAERRLLKAIRENDALVVQALANYRPCTIVTPLADKYIPRLLSLPEEARIDLFAYGFCSHTLVLLLQQLLAPESEGAAVPTEVRALTYGDRMLLTNEIIQVLMGYYGDEYEEEYDEGEDEYNEYDGSGDGECNGLCAEVDGEAEDEDGTREDEDDYEYLYDPKHLISPHDEEQEFDIGDEDETDGM